MSAAGSSFSAAICLVQSSRLAVCTESFVSGLDQVVKPTCKIVGVVQPLLQPRANTIRLPDLSPLHLS